jgi:membrane protein implicated in regulation of membrane protease activity
MGTARFGDLRLEVTAREGIIDPGVEVEVVEVDGIKVYVSAVVSNSVEKSN